MRSEKNAQHDKVVAIQWIEAIIQQCDGAVVAVDREHSILAANKPAKTSLGWHDQLIAGKALTSLVTPHMTHPDLPFDALLENALQTEEGISSEYRGDFELSDGRHFPVVGQLHAVRSPSGENLGALLTFQPTEEEEASPPEHAWQLTLIHRMTQALIASLDLDRVLETLLIELRDALGVVATSVWLVEAESDTLVCRQATGPKRDDIVGWQLPPGAGLVGWVVQHRESVMVANALHDERHFHGINEKTALALRSILAVPLCLQEHVIGVLEVVDSQPQRFTPEDLALVERFAPMAALAIRNAQLYGETNDIRRFNENILRSLEEGILLLDKEERVKFANPAAAKLLGYEPQALIGKAISDLLASPSLPKMFLLPRQHPREDTAPQELNLRMKSGSSLPVLCSARALHQRAGPPNVLVVFMDITQRKKATEALRSSERRLRSLIEAADDIIFVHSPEDGRIRFAHIPERFGVSASAVIERPLETLDLSSEVLQRFRKGLRQVVETKKPDSYEHEFKLGGSSYTILSTLTPITNDAGEVTAVLGIGRDITEHKRMEEELLHTERLVVTGKLAASVAHEINNPLQSVLGCLGLAQEALLDERDVGQYVQIAREEVRRIARIVSRMRNLYNPSSGKRCLANINPLLDEVLQLTAQSRREQNVGVRWEANTELPSLFIEPDQMRQVFLNLILNAIAAMPEGGMLTVQTRKTHRPAGVEIMIRDSGIGIPADVRPHIFEAFFSTKLDGTGLGLTISAGIIHQHQGTITVESEPDVGSTFRVWLPLTQLPVDISLEEA